jgi:hypothetical protein
LRQLGLLINSEEKAFADALWSRVDKESGLPSETSFRSVAFLNLPEPHPGQAAAAFRLLATKVPFPRRVLRVKNADGRETTQTSFWSPVRLIRDIIQATKIGTNAELTAIASNGVQKKRKSCLIGCTNYGLTMHLHGILLTNR